MTNGELYNCKKCGVLFLRNSDRELCDECLEKENVLIDDMIEFASQHFRKLTLSEISDSFKISLSDIEDLLVRGRLASVLPYITMKCRFCGAELEDDEKKNFTCKKCIVKLHTFVKKIV